MRIRSKCYWYKYGEKFILILFLIKSFLSLEKFRAAQSTIRNITKD